MQAGPESRCGRRGPRGPLNCRRVPPSRLWAARPERLVLTAGSAEECVETAVGRPVWPLSLRPGNGPTDHARHPPGQPAARSLLTSGVPGGNFPASSAITKSDSRIAEQCRPPMRWITSEEVIAVCASHVRGTASVVVLTVLSLAGCGSAPARPPATASSRPAQTEPHPTGKASVSPSPVLSARAAPAPASPVCRTSTLKMAVAWSGVAAGTVGGYLGFTNVGAAPCHLTGWPTLVSIPATGKGSTATHVHGTTFGPVNRAVVSVTIRPGQEADSVFTGHDLPAGNASQCPPAYRHFEVTPPATRNPLSSLPGCQAWVSTCPRVHRSPSLR